MLFSRFSQPLFFHHSPAYLSKFPNSDTMPKEYACGNRIIWSIVTAISVAVIIGGGVYYGSAVDGVDNECASDQTCCTNTDYCTSGLDSECPGSDTCNNEPDYWKFYEGPNTVCSPSVVTFIDAGDNSVNTEPCDFDCNTCTIINLSYFQPYYNACCKNTVPVCGNVVICVFQPLFQTAVFYL